MTTAMRIPVTVATPTDSRTNPRPTPTGHPGIEGEYVAAAAVTHDAREGATNGH